MYIHTVYIYMYIHTVYIIWMYHGCFSGATSTLTSFQPQVASLKAWQVGPEDEEDRRQGPSSRRHSLVMLTFAEAEMEVSIIMGYPNSWMANFMENPIQMK